ncbi:hypothetical protein VTN77DRAFT_8173 [Rasamsonia byssochlamydoides]|uniref:uncharacterized protein n=1 Tax=Rasamsonia byssochlamydoides TaxID=89139 RepID=UPI0037434453
MVGFTVSRLLADPKKPTRVRDSSWADGLRGIASIFVVSSHVTLCFARYVVPPALSENGPSALFQRPFLRLVGQGQAWVAVFFVLLGFVNSLKAVQLARVGAVNDALNSLATSTFRRTGRLVFPATAVTIIAWFFCQLGAFELAARTDAYWIRTTSPRPSASWGRAIDDLIRQLISTWVYGSNAYDQPQWALLNLFKGSLYVFTTLLATVNTTPRFRLCAEVVLYMWCWAVGDAIVGINVFAGMILAELSLIPRSKPKSTIANVIPYLFAILGLYLCSFPDSFYEQAAWSRQLWQIGLVIFPPNPMFGRFWTGIGAQILCFSILFSPSMRNALSNRYLLWLGGISYPLYLLHGPLMRSVMAYMLFLPASLTFKPDLLEDGTPDPESLIPVPSRLTLCLILPFFFAFLLVVVRLWAVKVEPYFGTATDAFERFARTWGKESSNSGKQNGSVLPTFASKD